MSCWARCSMAVLMGLITQGLAQIDTSGPSSRRTFWTISEIMPHPAARADGRNLEYVEIHNTGLIAEDLGGHRLSGAWDYTIPAGLFVPAGGFVVIAAQPTDVEAVYGLSGVLGGITNNLPNDGGTLRLRNPADAILLEVRYSDQTPWPAAADGAGHSLVLAQPSYGEGDPKAWAASAWIGGSPGQPEPVNAPTSPIALLNEILAHTDEPQLDFVEIFNPSDSAQDLSLCRITDNHDRAGYQIPAGTILPPRSAIAFDQSQLGFALDAAGETLWLFSSDDSRVIDALRFGPQANAVALGRWPDGAPVWSELLSPSPGSPNAAPRPPSVVINEIFYHPPSDDNDDEFVELHNLGDVPVDLSGWRLADGISFTFPTGTTLAAGGYLAIAHNAARLQTNYPGLAAPQLAGNFEGNLANTGERIALARPETLVSTNLDLSLSTNLVYVLVDEVTYADGGRWGRWADGGGSSLELTDPRADNRFPDAWADSDETAKSSWTTIESSGTLDLGVGSIDSLQVLLQGAGACLIDDIEVLNASNQNLIGNGTFDNDTAGWAFEGTHAGSHWEPSEGSVGSGALSVDATARGDTGANRIRTSLSAPMAPGSTATLRASARWLYGNPEVLLRLRGNYLEAFGRMQVPTDLGTPGQANSRLTAQSGPTFHHVTHQPVLPAAGQPVTVTARVQDPDGVGTVQLRYRVDPSNTENSLAMVDNGTGGDAFAGDGVYTATLPGQPGGSLIAFHLSASDASGSTATRTYPSSAPAVEGLIRFGEASPSGGLGVYRLWMTQATFARWSSRSVLDNTPLPVTFVYNNERVVHGVGALYAGSPHIAPSYNSPMGNLCGYVLLFPKDDRFLGATDVVLDWPGRDATAQQEPTAYWVARELDIPFNHRRFIRLHVNGRTETERGSIYEDAQQVNSDLVASWLPDGTDGNLYKIEQWFEFADNGSRYHTGPPRLEDYTTTGGAKKTARYRWCWLPRAVQSSANDFASLFTLADAANAANPETYIRQLESLIDVEEWMRVFAVENIIVNFDAWGYDIGKNMYAYKPPGSPWQLFMWDIDWVMLASAQHGYSPSSSLMYQTPSNFGDGNRDPVVGRMYDHPALQRAYWRAILEAVNGPLLPDAFTPRLEATHAALVAAGVTRSAGQTLTPPGAVANWLSQRRTFLLNQLAVVDAGFAITSADLDSANTGILRGTAPVTTCGLQVNGRAYPITWTSLTTWEVRLPLSQGVNTLRATGTGADGTPLIRQSDSTTLTYDGSLDSPLGALVINEIQYHPALPGSAFVEIFNQSLTTAFDLSGWELRGTDFNFPSGTWIAPAGYVLAANDRERLAQAFGIDTLAAGEFSGQLRNDGETLGFVIPGADPTQETLIDQVTYDDEPPWPTAADGQGPSLQLIDPTQDNRRPGNWTAVTVDPTNTPKTLVAMDHVWRYLDSGEDLGASWREPGYDDSLWPQGGALLYVESADLPFSKTTPLTHGAITYYFRTEFTFEGDPSKVSLALSTVIDDGAVFYLNGQEALRLRMAEGAVDYQTLASTLVGDATLEMGLSLPTDLLQTGVNVLAVEVHQIGTGSSDIVFGLALDTAPQTELASSTPGRANAVLQSLPAFPALWINEFQPFNATGPQDRFGDTDPWVELYNAGDTAVSLDNVALSDTNTDLTRWLFPAGLTLDPGQWRVVWLDGEPGESSPEELHAGFRTAPTDGVLLLTQVLNGTARVLDSVRYAAVSADTTFALMPDGNADDRRLFTISTPGGLNAWPPRPQGVRFNEWMALNQGSVSDPADNDADDWFELYNTTGFPVDLSGCFLSDDPLNPAKYTIPAGTVLPASGYLLCWADEESAQTAAGSGLHVSFKLAQSGESLVLTAPDGTTLDAVQFGPQTADVSEGSWPDGAATAGILSAPTPGSPNAPWTGQLEAPYLLGLEIDTAQNTCTATWSTAPGAVYRLQSSATLAPAAWQDLTTDLTAVDTSLVVPNIPLDDSAHTYYRVVVVP